MCNNWQTWILRISESEISRVASARCLREADKAEQQEVKKRGKEEKQNEQEKVENKGNEEKQTGKEVAKAKGGNGKRKAVDILEQEEDTDDHDIGNQPRWLSCWSSLNFKQTQTDPTTGPTLKS